MTQQPVTITRSTFQPVTNLPETLNLMFCTSRSELQYYPNLAGNEILLQNGTGAKPVRLSMGKKIDDLLSRKRARQDFEEMCRPFGNAPGAFFCTVTFALSEGGQTFHLYRVVQDTQEKIRRWAGNTNSVLACTSHYARFGQAPHLNVVSFPRIAETPVQSLAEDYRASFAHLFDEYTKKEK